MMRPQRRYRLANCKLLSAWVGPRRWLEGPFSVCQAAGKKKNQALERERERKRITDLEALWRTWRKLKNPGNSFLYIPSHPGPWVWRQNGGAPMGKYQTIINHLIIGLVWASCSQLAQIPNPPITVEGKKEFFDFFGMEKSSASRLVNHTKTGIWCRQWGNWVWCQGIRPTGRRLRRWRQRLILLNHTCSRRALEAGKNEGFSRPAAAITDISPSMKLVN